MDWIARYWIEALFGVIAAGLTYGYNRIAKRVALLQNRWEAVQDGLQAMLRDHLVAAYEKATDRGYVPFYERESIEKMYVQYKKLGGNGSIDHLLDEINDLPSQRVSPDQ